MSDKTVSRQLPTQTSAASGATVSPNSARIVRVRENEILLHSLKLIRKDRHGSTPVCDYIYQ